MSGRTLTLCKLLVFGLIVGLNCSVSDAQPRRSRSAKHKTSVTAPAPAPTGEMKITGQRIILPTGVTLEVEEVSRQGEEVWYHVQDGDGGDCGGGGGEGIGEGLGCECGGHWVHSPCAL